MKQPVGRVLGPRYVSDRRVASWEPGDNAYTVSLGDEGTLLVFIYHDDVTAEVNPKTALEYSIWQMPIGDGIIREQKLVHQHCYGPMRIIGLSPTRAVLICEECYLRINFPATIRTYKEFEEFVKTRS